MSPRDTQGEAGGGRGLRFAAGAGGVRVEDEDDDLGLPAFDGADEEPAAGVALEADLDLGADAESEDVGLDATEGTGETLDDEIGTTDAEEATRWSDGSDAREDARDLDADADLLVSEEYGWTDHNDPADDDDLDDEPEFDEGQALLPGDRGEEGLEDGDGGEGDLAALPPLDSGPEEASDDDDPFALDVLGELTGGALPDESDPGSGAP